MSDLILIDVRNQSSSPRFGGVIITALDEAETYLNLEEVEGPSSHPAILAMLREVAPWPRGDDVPWCSAFANHVAARLRLQRSKSLGARTWLKVGTPVALTAAMPGMDVVVFKRGTGAQPGPDVIDAPGHVAFLRRVLPGYLEVVGGNQSDAVTVARYRVSDVLGVRRLGAAA